MDDGESSVEEKLEAKRKLREAQLREVERKREQGGGDGDRVSKGKDEEQPTGDRENMVQGAVQFFTSPAVRKSPRSEAVAFLKRKGLTDSEIAAAQKRADAILASAPQGAASSADGGATTTTPPPPTAGAPPPPPGAYPYPYPYPPPAYPPPKPVVVRGPGVLQQAAATAGLVVMAYGAFQAVSRFVSPLLFGADGEGKEDAQKQKAAAVAEAEKARRLEQKIDALETTIVDTSRTMASQTAFVQSAMSSSVEAMTRVSANTRALNDSLRTARDAAPARAGRTGDSREEIDALRAEVAHLRKLVQERVTSPPAPAAAPTGAAQLHTATRNVLSQLEEEDTTTQDDVSAFNREPFSSVMGTLPATEGSVISESSAVATSVVDSDVSAQSRTPAVPHSSNFIDLMNKMKQGITPSDIRTDIDDSPTHQTTAPAAGARTRPLKPWELRRKQKYAETQERSRTEVSASDSVADGTATPVASMGDVASPAPTPVASTMDKGKAEEPESETPLPDQ